MVLHYLRPMVKLVQENAPKSVRSPTWDAVAFSASMMIGVLMAMFHYPNNFLENGTGVGWAWLGLEQTSSSRHC